MNSSTNTYIYTLILLDDTYTRKTLIYIKFSAPCVFGEVTFASTRWDVRSLVGHWIRLLTVEQETRVQFQAGKSHMEGLPRRNFFADSRYMAMGRFRALRWQAQLAGERMTKSEGQWERQRAQRERRSTGTGAGGGEGAGREAGGGLSLLHYLF